MQLHHCFALTTLLAALLMLAGPGQVHATQSTPGAANARPEDAFTPVVVRPLGQRHVVAPGTDNLYHVVYELELTNTKAAAATLQRIDVLDAAAPSRPITSYAGKDLLGGLRTLQPAPADNVVIAPNVSRLFYVELAFADAAAIPHTLMHRLVLRGSANPGPHTPATPLDYTVARVELSRTPLPVIEPPLRGAGWVAVNGCCNSDIVHRGSEQSVNGALYNSQRYAIDWMRLDKHGQLVHGDPADVHSYPDYGAEVYAVADGTVVETLDVQDDNVPGKLPDPTTLTLRTVDGNHVILAIGHGLYAFYAHLRKGSITVHAGEQIKAGMVIGNLGDTGNTSAPHLHFHVMDGPSSIGSEGVPYVIGHFELTGQVDVKAFAKAAGVEGHWGTPPIKPVMQKGRFPLNLNIVDFTAH
ncbi:MAG: M23 family metallopeptidase [Rhodanobacter sp.]